MDIATATRSGAFDLVSCNCGKCTGTYLASKNALLVDVRDQAVQAFCFTTASYVKVFITYHRNVGSRTILASWEVRNPASDVVLRSEEAKPVPHVLVPSTEAGEERLLGLLRVRATLSDAARRRRAA
jgi:hypothetical protein